MCYKLIPVGPLACAKADVKAATLQFSVSVIQCMLEHPADPSSNVEYFGLLLSPGEAGSIQPQAKHQ